MIKIQTNASRNLDIISRIYKTAEIPTTTTAAASAIAQFASLSQKQLNGLNVVDSFYRSLHQNSALQKVLHSYNISTKSLSATAKSWEAASKNLDIINGFYSNYHPAIDDTLTKVLGRLSVASSIPDMSSFQRLLSGIENVNEDLFEIINESYYEDDDIEDFESQEGFASNAEIQEALEEQSNNPIGFQEKFSHWTEKKKQQFFIVYVIISILYSIFLEPYLQENVGLPVTAWTIAHVKELPEKAGKYITDLKSEIEAIIVENVPYYYKVSFIDENGELKEGYVSKKSVRLIEAAIQESEEEIDEVEEILPLE